ncbi:hypothetical protein J6590_069660 [Homalodisca vitripennis]|nr:hypothetical protein J6590_069660 [Homalodisca vitripennis]
MEHNQLKMSSHHLAGNNPSGYHVFLRLNNEDDQTLENGSCCMVGKCALIGKMVEQA